MSRTQIVANLPGAVAEVRAALGVPPEILDEHVVADWRAVRETLILLDAERNRAAAIGCGVAVALPTKRDEDERRAQFFAEVETHLAHVGPTTAKHVREFVRSRLESDAKIVAELEKLARRRTKLCDELKRSVQPSSGALETLHSHHHSHDREAVRERDGRLEVARKALGGVA